MRFILVRGIPGSGKSTFASKAFGGAFHVENDMFHVKDGAYRFDARRQKDAVAWCMDMCRAALRNGMDAVVSNTFTKRKYVAACSRLAAEASAEFSVYRMTGSFPNRHAVPPDVFENMKKGFEDWPGEIFVSPAGDGYEYSPAEKTA